MTFREEKIADSLEEAKPLLAKHWKEIAHYQDIPLDPDYEIYIKMESIGVLRAFTCRDVDSKMIGYAVFLIKPHMHYKTCLMAYQDIIYIEPSRRGVGGFFMRWLDEQLKTLGVQVVSQHVKSAHNFGPILERMGYELQDLIYTKRLDK